MIPRPVRRKAALIQPQQLIEIPCILANGSSDLVERHEGLKGIIWYYMIAEQEFEVAWQVKKQKPKQKGFGTRQGYEWGQYASLITRIPKAPS